MNNWSAHCKILNVPENASEEQIRQAYIELAKILHPDKHQNSDIAKIKFQELQNSYDYLKQNFHKNGHPGEVKPESPPNRPHEDKPQREKSQSVFWVKLVGAVAFCLSYGFVRLLFSGPSNSSYVSQKITTQQKQVQSPSPALGWIYTASFMPKQQSESCDYKQIPEENIQKFYATADLPPISYCGNDVRIVNLDNPPDFHILVVSFDKDGSV